MMQKVATKVPFVLDNVSKCLCPEVGVGSGTKERSSQARTGTRRLLRCRESYLRRH
jgi:hypothetical protein